MKYMYSLSLIALKKEIPIIVTNQLLKKQDTEYEKLDFERLSERKDYYKTDNGKENAIIMHRIL